MLIKPSVKEWRFFMNIIIVGCGKVGQKIAEQLSFEADHNITVVDTDYNIVQDTINKYDILGVAGNGASLDTLTEAGVKDADLLIAVTGSDELNLITCLIAKKSGNCQTIARVRNPEYNKEINLFKHDLGLAMIINPELTAAAEIARILRFPSAIKIDTFAKGRIEVLKFRVPENSVLDNLAVMDIQSKLDSDVLVCGVERNDEAFIPRGSFVLKAKDVVSIVASPKHSWAFFKKIKLKTNRVKNVIIAGGGETADYLASMLLHNGIDVKIIEKNPARAEKLCLLLPNATIINADATDNRVLLEEGIESVGAFVSLTNMDEENILLSLFAKSKSEAKLVTKINKIAYDKVIGGLDLDTVIYPKNITAEYIVRFVRALKNTIGSNIETMHKILEGKAEALEFNICENSPVSNIAIENLSLKDNVLIASINRNGKILTPRGRDMILQGDTVIVITTHTGCKDISDILRK